jgi:hypothetical protein
MNGTGIPTDYAKRPLCRCQHRFTMSWAQAERQPMQIDRQPQLGETRNRASQCCPKSFRHLKDFVLQTESQKL